MTQFPDNSVIKMYEMTEQKMVSIVFRTFGLIWNGLIFCSYILLTSLNASESLVATPLIMGKSWDNWRHPTNKIVAWNMG